MPSNWSDKLLTLSRPLLPPIETAQTYTLRKLRGDLVAGLTVAVITVPQSMAYAIIAGVAPQYGLYTAIIQGIVGSLFSSSRYLSVGPINTQSLLVASTASRLVGITDGATYLQLVLALTIFKGLIQLLFAVAQMGTLVRYVSHSVIVGFTAGAGVLIAVGQLPSFLGIDLTGAVRRLPGVAGQIEMLWPHLHQVNPIAIGVGTASLAGILGVWAISRLLPGPLLAVVLGGVLVAAFGWTEQQLPLVPPIPQGLPALHVPAVEPRLLEAMIPGAIALALLGMLEAVSVGKTLSTRTGERISANQEFFGQGLANLLSGFFQCIPGSGSFSRTALSHQAGAKTRFSGIYAALFVLAILLVLAPAARYIPLSSLAAILFIIAYGLIDWGYIGKIIRTSGSDTAVCLVTFLATLTAPLEYAIFIGIFLNIASYLRRAGQLHMAEMVQTPAGPFLEQPLRVRGGEKKLMFLQVEGDLFFAVADEMRDRLTEILNSGVRIVILRLKRTHSVDATVLRVLEQFAGEMKRRGGHVLLCGIRPELMMALQRFGLVDVLGPENVFETGFGIFTSAKRALQRARKLVGDSIDATGIDVEEEEFTYQI